MDGGRTLLDSEAPPCLVFGDGAINVQLKVLRGTVFLNEKLDLLLCFASWPFSTVFSQVLSLFYQVIASLCLAAFT